MSQNYDKAPWHVVRYGDGESLVICLDEAGNQRVAFMATPGCRDQQERRKVWKRLKANARLIAQAPAMVEALRGFVKIELQAGATHLFCDHCEAQSDDNDNCDHEPDCTLGNALAILAQIDGGAA